MPADRLSRELTFELAAPLEVGNAGRATGLLLTRNSGDQIITIVTPMQTFGKLVDSETREQLTPDVVRQRAAGRRHPVPAHGAGVLRFLVLLDRYWERVAKGWPAAVAVQVVMRAYIGDQLRSHVRVETPLFPIVIDDQWKRRG